MKREKYEKANSYLCLRETKIIRPESDVNTEISTRSNRNWKLTRENDVIFLLFPLYP